MNKLFMKFGPSDSFRSRENLNLAVNLDNKYCQVSQDLGRVVVRVYLDPLDLDLDLSIGNTLEKICQRGFTVLNQVN